MIGSQPLSTIFFTPTRSPAKPIYLTEISTDFNIKGNLNGWHTEFNDNSWLQLNGDTSNFFGTYGPGSDDSSLSKLIKILFNLRLKIFIFLKF